MYDNFPIQKINKLRKSQKNDANLMSGQKCLPVPVKTRIIQKPKTVN